MIRCVVKGRKRDYAWDVYSFQTISMLFSKPKKPAVRYTDKIKQESGRLARSAKSLFLLGVKKNEVLAIVRDAMND